MPKLLITLTIFAAIGLTSAARAELGSDVPTDAQLLAQRVQEGGTAGAGIFDVAVPPADTILRPVKSSVRQVQQIGHG